MGLVVPCKQFLQLSDTQLRECRVVRVRLGRIRDARTTPTRRLRRTCLRDGGRSN